MGREVGSGKGSTLYIGGQRRNVIVRRKSSLISLCLLASGFLSLFLPGPFLLCGVLLSFPFLSFLLLSFCFWVCFFLRFCCESFPFFLPSHRLFSFHYCLLFMLYNAR